MFVKKFRGLGKFAVPFFITALILVSSMGLVTIRGVRGLESSSGWVSHTFEVLNELQKLQTLVEQSHAATIKFVLLQDPAYHEGFQKTNVGIDRSEHTLLALTSDNLERESDLPKLFGSIQEELDALNQQLMKVSQHPNEYPAGSLAAGIIKSDARILLIRENFESIRENENALLQTRLHAASTAAWSVKLYVGCAALIAIVLLLVKFTITKNEIDRSASLQKALRDEATRLEAVNKELEAFSYSVSHDLRAPVRHIHGFVKLIQDRPSIQGDPTAAHQLGIIANAAKQMGVLIDELLAFSRLSRTELNFGEVEMNSLIKQVVHSFAPDLEGRKVTWKIHPLPAVKGDLTTLTLVWTNLISNALKYSRRRDESVIEIGTLPDSTAPSAGTAVMFIKDNGVGFNMKYAHKLFGVFQRLHRAEEFEGTGIGLATVQRIIHRHLGKVWVESTEGQGATFFVSLPTT